MMSTTEYYFMFSEGIIKNNEVVCCSVITAARAGGLQASPGPASCLTYWEPSVQTTVPVPSDAGG